MTVYLLGEVTAGTRNFRSRRCDYAPEREGKTSIRLGMTEYSVCIVGQSERYSIKKKEMECT